MPPRFDKLRHGSLRGNTVIEAFARREGTERPGAYGLHNPWLDDVVAFLASLTSAEYKEQGVIELARQRALSRAKRPQRDTARAFGPRPSQPKPPTP